MRHFRSRIVPDGRPEAARHHVRPAVHKQRLLGETGPILQPAVSVELPEKRQVFVQVQGQVSIAGRTAGRKERITFIPASAD